MISSSSTIRTRNFVAIRSSKLASHPPMGQCEGAIALYCDVATEIGGAPLKPDLRPMQHAYETRDGLHVAVTSYLAHSFGSLTAVRACRYLSGSESDRGFMLDLAEHSRLPGMFSRR